MNAAILSIGTEITAGQILNSNAQWISEQLKKLGVETLYHIAIPDDRKMIVDALKYVQHCKFIFVTGGLGPTSDDLTRDMVAEWAEKKMIFDEDSYDHIKNRLKARGVTLRDSQKQQCYFPDGAKILHNQNGTANAFYFESQFKNNVFVLPGPPKEILGLWQDHIAAMMDKLCEGIDALVTESWNCTGAGESEVAFLTENALTGCTLEKGYRFHTPNVEVKLTFRKSQSAEAQTWIKKIDEALKHLVFERNGKRV